MTIEATYRDGAFYPTQPITLPENTRVEVSLPVDQAKQLSREELLTMRPESPRITPEEFEAIVRKHAVSVGSLPANFSRADIYSDHD